MTASQELNRIRRDLEEKRNALRSALEDRRTPRPADADNRDRADLANDYRARNRRAALTSMDEQQLAQIDHALTRMDQGSYGMCEQCGNPIAAKRLEFLPQATLCMSCQEAAA